MNSKFYRYFFVAAFLLNAYSGYCQQKNVLFIHFEPQHFTPNDPPDYSAVFSVFYRLQCPKPSNFHGFEARMVFEKSKISVAGGDRPVFYDGTASAGADFKVGNYDPDLGELRAEVLAFSQMLDTTNKLLFQFQASSKLSPGDSALMTVTLFDPISSSSGIDTVIIDNAPDRDDISWYPFAIAYADTQVVIPPKKQDILLSSDSISIDSDSVGTDSISLTNVDLAKITTGIFTCTIDTSIIEVDTVEAVNPAMTITPIITSDSLEINFSSSAPIQPSGPVWNIRVHAKPRIDTVCTVILNPKLLITNADNLVASIAYDFDSICILGQAKKDTTSETVQLEDASESFSIDYQAGILRLAMTDPILLKKDIIRIFSQTGALVYSAVMQTAESSIALRLSNGVYLAEIENGSIHRRKRFIVVH